MTGYRYENQFKYPGITNGGRQFCEYQNFCNEIFFFFSLFIISIFFESLKSKSKQMLGSQKGNSGVTFNDTLLNFGL